MSAHAATVSSRRAAIDVIVQLVGQILNLVLGVVVTSLIAHSLGATRFGEWVTIFSMSQIFGFFTTWGLGGVAVRHATAEPEREAEWIGAYATLTAALTVPIAIVYAVVMLAISTSHEMRVASLVLSLLFFAGLGATVSTTFRLRVRNDVSVAFVTLNSVLWAGAVIAIVAGGGGMIALAIAFLLTAALVQWSQALLAIRTSAPRLRGSRAMWPALAKIGVAVGIGTMLTVSYARIDQVLVFELAPHQSEAGIYGAIYRVLDQAAFVPAAVMTTLFPIISSAHPSDPLRVRRLVQIALDYLSMASLPALAFSIVAAEPLIELLFGAQYVQGADGLPVLLGAYVVICFGYVSGNMIVATGLQRRYIGYAFVGLVVNVALNLLLIPRYGYIAAAWTTLLTNIVVIFPALYAIFREIDMRPSVGRILRIALAAAASGLLVAALRRAGVPFAGLAGAMVVVYLLLLLALRALDIGEVREVLASRHTRPAG
ncbi:MAG TPA: flippase [Solirubrobacteraceae bacterium]|jgi:O-antigen/teichoic acid export membrane protein